MGEKELYEQIGRQAIALAEKQAEVDSCIGVIHGLKVGTYRLDDLVTTPTSFSVTPTPVEDVIKS